MNRKVTVVGGAGNVGATVARAIAVKELADVVIVDIAAEKAQGIALDSAGSLYIADTVNCRVRQVAAGIITTIAGDGTCAYLGDGGPATSASVNRPVAVTVDSGCNVYIADTFNDVVREVSPVVPCTPVPATCADVTGDGLVTAADVVAEVRAIRKRSLDPKYDLNHDGHVDVLDLRFVARHLGQRC